MVKATENTSKKRYVSIFKENCMDIQLFLQFLLCCTKTAVPKIPKFSICQNYTTRCNFMHQKTFNHNNGELSFYAKCKP